MSPVRAICALGLLTVMSSVGYCDMLPGRNPLPRPPVVAPVRIVEGDDPEAATRIVIPKSLLPDLLKLSDAQPASNETPNGGTIVAGLALTGAAISLMFVLRNSPRRKLGLACLIGCVVLAAIVLLMDDSILLRSKPRGTSAGSAETQSQIEIVIQDQGHEVILTVPPTK